MSTSISIQRLTRTDESATSIGSSSVSKTPNKKWRNWLPLFIALVFIAEISFLGKLDMAEKANLVNSWADSFYQFTTSSWPNSKRVVDETESGQGLVPGSCEEWLEREDYVAYFRDFEKEPILIQGIEQTLKSCSVGCKFKFGTDTDKKPDATFRPPHQNGTASVLRSMESALYYPENNLTMARRRGYDVVMTTSLSSDVPVGYFSWAEYDIMAPVQPKTENALAAAFVSNCGARNFRLQALEALERANIRIDSYGSCHHNKDGKVDKVEALKRYKFSLAFENSNEEDYVTEKFFQSLVAGSIPVVVGAPNIQDFAPSPTSLLHIKELKDAESVAKTMKSLAENPIAYNESLRWKFEGPSDAFKALVDMAAVHSSCRLCIFLGTRIREREERSPTFMKRPCKCTRGTETVYHVYVRERGRFEMDSIFLRSSNLSLQAFESAVLAQFKSVKHVPVWKEERPQVLRGGDELKLYKVYPVGLTQRQALYSFRFNGDIEFKNYIESHPCAKFEAIFV
ncbi:glycoprotein 3-alpha-L-fucosyltransferase A-like [Lycium barbarum]|uniref:glycoprotein 3-alpha-L-fucosyltransferase A-like n=1 Tax=Lycium barbarum TaxID=112863 RepID=UPI00293F244B|nr:glycoprotein 3-alpha-L-fucosyltransferase A-like [Lycium barbarum]